MRPTSQNSLVLVIDLQERLMPAIHGAERVEAAARLLIDAARLFDVPIIASEQYPRGLGPTRPAIAEVLPQPPLPKVVFSAYGDDGLHAAIEAAGRKAVVIVGVEAHVCVLQTTLDLIAAGYTVFVARDAVGSRAPENRDTAMELLRAAGAVITCVETVAFEWCGAAGTDRFKALSKLVK